MSNIYLENSRKSSKNIQNTHFELQKSVCQTPETIGTSRSSLRRLNSMTGSSAQIRNTAEYLVLEKEADADWEQGFQSDWVDGYGNVYREREFFRNIANRYTKAASIAMDLGHISEAVRMMEKEALVYSEKLDILPRSIDLILNAWKLCNQMGNRATAESFFQKLLVLADQNIASLRIEEVESELTSLNSMNLIGALLLKAKILDVTGSSLEQRPLYEEAGQLCLDLDAEETSFGHLNAALIAGLCFEKSEKMKDQAVFSYEKVLEMKEDLLAIFREEGADLSGEKKIEMGFYKLIYFAPACLQISLASLKCGKTNLFIEMIDSQVNQFISLIHLILANSKESQTSCCVYEIDDCIDYMKALVHVSEICLGSDVSGLSKIKKALQEIPKFNSEESQILDRQQLIEDALLAIYMAPKETSVDEMVRRLENRDLLLAP